MTKTMEKCTEKSKDTKISVSVQNRKNILLLTIMFVMIGGMSGCTLPKENFPTNTESLTSVSTQPTQKENTENVRAVFSPESTANRLYIKGMGFVPEDILMKDLIPQQDVDEIILENGITGIDENAFAYCERLNRVTLSENISVVKDGAFSYCENLKEIKISDNNPYLTVEDNILFNKL